MSLNVLRRSVSYFALGGNTYSPNGVKAINFNTAGDQWLGPSTFRVAFQLNTPSPPTKGLLFQVLAARTLKLSA